MYHLFYFAHLFSFTKKFGVFRNLQIGFIIAYEALGRCRSLVYRAVSCCFHQCVGSQRLCAFVVRLSVEIEEHVDKDECIRHEELRDEL